MTNNFTEQKLPLSMEKLFLNSRELEGYLERDAAEFVKYGFGEPERTAFSLKVENFRQLHYDIEKVDEQKQSGFEKSGLAEALRESILELQNKTDYAYNMGKVKYRLFDLGGVSQHDLDQLRRVAEVYIRMLRGRVGELSAFGLSAGDLEQLETLNAQYCEAFVEHNWKKSERKVATVERRINAWDLYLEYSSLCKLGRQIWARTNPAKSSNYVINMHTFDTSPDEVEV